MNEKSNNMLSGISPKKKKYLILIGIYLLCLLIGTFANPWSSSPYDIGRYLCGTHGRKLPL